VHVYGVVRSVAVVSGRLDHIGDHYLFSYKMDWRKGGIWRSDISYTCRRDNILFLSRFIGISRIAVSRAWIAWQKVNYSNKNIEVSKNGK